MLSASSVLRNCEELFLALGRDKIRYFAKKGKLNVGGDARSERELSTVIESLGPDWSVYVTLNPTRAGASLKARSLDVTTWEYLLIDIDPMEPDADPQGALSEVMRAAELLLPAAERASHIVSSGRGIQAWLKVRPVSLAATDHRTVERACSAFLRALPMVKGCRVDSSCSDLARVARCPGSVNTKTGRGAFFMAQAQVAADPQFILDLCPPEDVEAQRHPPPSGLPFSELLPHLTNRAATYLTQGTVSPGRHAAAYAAAISLAEANVKEDEAVVFVLRAAAYCSPPLTGSEARRAVRNAYSNRRGL